MSSKLKIGIGVVLVAVLAAVVLSTKTDLFQGNYFKQFGKPYSAPASKPFDIPVPSRQRQRPATSPAQASAAAPILRLASNALSTTRIIQALQDVAIFEVVNPVGNQTIELVSMSFQCFGSGADNIGLEDNPYKVSRNGALYNVGSANCRAPGAIRAEFPSQYNQPILLEGGSSATILLRYDTSADAGQWRVGETLTLQVIPNGLEWIVAANQANRRTDIAGSGYPVRGPTLIY